MDGRASDAAHRRIGPGVVLALACAGQFMVVLDVSVVNVALPSMRTALGFTPVGLQWVVNAYTLAFGGFLLLGGRLADLYGHRRIFTAGLALFALSSLVGGLAGTPGMLVAARGVQGLGAAVLAPATLTVLTATFPEGARRTRALAVWTAVSLAGGAAGNLAGGVLTDYLSWRSILLVNVPIGVAAAVLAARYLASDPASATRRRLDVPGALLVTGGLVALTYAVGQAQERGWGGSVVILAVLVAAAALAAFVLVETRVAAPLMPLRLFRIRAISLGNLVMLLAGACFQVPMWYFLTLYMQTVLHYTALHAGLGFLPHTVLALVVGLRLTPWLMRRVEHRALIAAGALLAAVGFWWQGRITPDDTYLTGILGPAILVSVGGGLFNTPLTTTVTSGVAREDGGAASGLMNTAKQAGGALGLSILAALASHDAATPAALTEGYRRAFLAMAVLAALIAALAVTLPSRRDGPEPRVTGADRRRGGSAGAARRR